MSRVEVAEAEGKLRELLDRADAGEEIVIVEKGRKRAVIVATQEERTAPRWGILAGKARIPPNFNAPLPDDLLDLFEGR